MPKTRPVSPNECEKVALSLGFEFKKFTGDHKQFKKDGVGKVTIPQYKEISGDLFGWILDQLKIKKNEFFKILDEL